MAAALLPGPLPSRTCRNQPCGAGASRHGDAAALGLCSRCFHAFSAEEAEALGGGGAGGDAGYASDGGMLYNAAGDDALAARYLAQVTAGCGAAACANPRCATGRRGGGGGGDAAAGDPSAELAWLLQEAQARRYWVCVPHAAGAGGEGGGGRRSRSGTDGSLTLGGAADVALRAGPLTAGAGAPPRPPLPASAAAAGGKRKTTASRVAGAFF